MEHYATFRCGGRQMTGIIAVPREPRHGDVVVLADGVRRQVADWTMIGGCVLVADRWHRDLYVIALGSPVPFTTPAPVLVELSPSGKN